MTSRTLLLALGCMACAGTMQNTPPPSTATVTPTVPAPPAVPHDAPPPTRATVSLESRTASTVTGTATFEQTASGLQVVIKIAGAKPGKHGAHFHETGDCSAPDAKSAGGHFNPAGTAHGAPAAVPHHGGDLGNIEAGAGGTGTLSITLPDVTLAGGPTAVWGRSVVIHDGEDDLHSQPAGNSGARVACGVIK